MRTTRGFGTTVLFDECGPSNGNRRWHWLRSASLKMASWPEWRGLFPPSRRVEGREGCRDAGPLLFLVGCTQAYRDGIDVACDSQSRIPLLDSRRLVRTVR